MLFGDLERSPEWNNSMELLNQFTDDGEKFREFICEFTFMDTMSELWTILRWLRKGFEASICAVFYVYTKSNTNYQGNEQSFKSFDWGILWFNFFFYGKICSNYPLSSSLVLVKAANIDI